MSRRKTKKKQRLQGKREQRGGTSGSAVANATKQTSKPNRVTSLADIGQLDIQTAGPPTCQGFKVVDGEITDTRCQFKLRSDADREAGYCPHHIDQAPEVADHSAAPEPNSSWLDNPGDSPKEEITTMTTASTDEVELVQATLDFNDLDDRFDWDLIKAFGLPTRDPLNMDPEDAIEFLQPDALDEHVPLRDEDFLFALGDGKFCFVANPKTVEIMGRNTHYDGIIAGDSRIHMFTDAFNRVANTVRSARAGDPEARGAKGSELNHRMVSPTLLSYFRRLIYVAGYPAQNDGQLTWATSALLSRQFTFEDLSNEARRAKEEKLAYKELAEQRRQEAETGYSGMFDQIRQTSTPPAAPKTNGHGRVKASVTEEQILSDMRQRLLDMLGEGERSFKTLVLTLQEEFGDAASDSQIGKVAGEFAKVYSQVGLSLDS